jgi:glycosyltransferase involved in cell wall biosynthesis
MYQFVPWLEAAGATVIDQPFFDDAYLAGYFGRGVKGRRATAAAFRRRFRSVPTWQDADLLWIEKELFPFLPGRFEALARKSGRPYIVDYDDALFHNYDESRNPLVRRLLSNKLEGLIRDAALITVGNQYLADYAQAHGAKKVALLPTVVDPDRYPVRPSSPDPALRVGWIGTPANARYLEPVIAAMNRLSAEIPLRLVTIGAPALETGRIVQERHEWSEDREADLLRDIEVGVMPLQDAPWERGKCGYKLIQYMAAGKPIIASPVGVNRSIVTPEVGFLAETEAEWMDGLRLFASDPAARIRMGAASRARFEMGYSTKVFGPKLVRLFADAIREHEA